MADSPYVDAVMRTSVQSELVLHESPPDGMPAPLLQGQPSDRDPPPGPYGFDPA